MATTPIKSQGTINSAEVTLYKTPQGKRATISLLSFKKIQNASYSVILYRVIDGVTKNVRFNVSLNSGEFIEDDSLYELSANDSFVAAAINGPVDYIVNGQEVDI